MGAKSARCALSYIVGVPLVDTQVFSTGEDIMALSISKDTARESADALHISMFPTNGLLETKEQIRRFELLRLAFFVLKLRKLEQRGQTNGDTRGIATKERAPVPGPVTDEQGFRISLLRHVIFQQVLTLIQLDAREQALQIIDACQK